MRGPSSSLRGQPLILIANLLPEVGLTMRLNPLEIVREWLYKRRARREMESCWDILRALAQNEAMRKKLAEMGLKINEDFLDPRALVPTTEVDLKNDPRHVWKDMGPAPKDDPRRDIKNWEAFGVCPTNVDHPQWRYIGPILPGMKDPNK